MLFMNLKTLDILESTELLIPKFEQFRLFKISGEHSMESFPLY